jgi:hypothetical protein
VFDNLKTTILKESKMKLKESKPKAVHMQTHKKKYRNKKKRSNKRCSFITAHPMQVMNPMMQMNQHHNQFGFAQGQSNHQFGRQAPPVLNNSINSLNNTITQMNGCMINGGMVQYGMMNQMGFNNPNQMGFNQFNGFGQQHQFIPPSHQDQNQNQNQFNMQMNRNRFNSRDDAPNDVIEIDCSSSESNAESREGECAHRIKQEIEREKQESNSLIEFDAGSDDDDSDYDDVEGQERIISTQY